ncbi:MAG: diguanylate cyclase [Myxococcota bacterium]|nr:diguanylate cyclase [Myxococcota bacterium]
MPSETEGQDVPVSPAVPPYGRLSVLVVDADEASRHDLEQALRLLGHDCRSAKDGVEALEIHQANRADVVLSDWKMPRIDGVELCRRLRAADGEGAYTYFIFMTGFDDKEHFLRGMEAGADDYHSKPVDIDELRARLTSAGRVVSLYRKLAERTSELRRDSQASFRMARVDALTGIGNRLRMDEDLPVLWSQIERYPRRYSVALCDVDEFKSYNDHFGHVAGDEVLRLVAQTLRQGLRQGDGLYRYGGDEFLVVLPEQSPGEAARIMERLRGEVEDLRVATTGAGRSVTISAGVAALDVTKDACLVDWLCRTDAALYRAKNAGRNRVTF